MRMKGLGQGLSASLAVGVSALMWADTHHVWMDSPNEAAPYLTWDTAAHSITGALAACGAGGTVLVTDGVYTASSTITVNSGQTVRSQNGPEHTTVNGIACRVFYILSGVVDGFTICGRDHASNGGGVSMKNGSLLNCNVVSNSTTGQGGGIFMEGGTISNCLVACNNNTHYGGGIRLYKSGSVIRCCISNNTCSGNLKFGGGLYLDSAACLISETRVIGNRSANSVGGGIYMTGGTVRDCQVVDNSSQSGGGLDMRGGLLVRSSVIGNHTDGSGGGVHNSTGAGSVIDCLVAQNTAAYYGGGLFFDIADGVASNCMVVGNWAASGGGVYGKVAGTRFVNCLIAGNACGNNHGGGATLLYGRMDNCTVVKNLSDNEGGGVYLLYGGITNTIVYDNEAAGAYANTRGTGGYGYSCSPGLQHDPAGTGNITTDPRFYALGSGSGTNHQGGDFRIPMNSPCRDRGFNLDGLHLTRDLAGRPRVYPGGGLVDIGCYEAYPFGTQIVIQ